MDSTADGNVDYYTADVVNANDYYPFGMLMPERKYSASDVYRYGFNGKENDNEVKGEGNQQDYGMRVYDPRIGKFLSVDPLIGSFPYYSPYQFAGNTPMQAIDLDGLEPKGYKWDDPYIASHPGSGVKYIASEYDGYGLYGTVGDYHGLLNAYAVQDVDGKTYLIYEDVHKTKQWAVEYDKDGWKGNVNSFTWSSPPNPADVLTAMTVAPLVVIPGLVVYGKAALYYIGEEVLEESLNFPIIPDPGDVIQKEIREKAAQKLLKKEVSEESATDVGQNSVGAMRRLEYKGAPYHGKVDGPKKNKGPKNGQDALDISLQIKSTSTRRIGIDYQTKEFVVFDETGKGSGIFHGHVRTWDQLTDEMKKLLKDAKMADKKGKIVIEND